MQWLSVFIYSATVFATGAEGDPDVNERIAQLERAVNQLMETRTWVSWLTGTNLLGVLALWLSLHRYIRKKIKTQLTDLLRSEYQTVESMVDKEARNRELLENQEFVVLRFGKEKAVYRQLINSGFKKVHDRLWDDKKTDTFFDQYPDSYLLVLDEPPSEIVNLWLEEFPKRRFVAFTENRLNVIDPGRVVFANSLMTLVARTLNAVG